MPNLYNQMPHPEHACPDFSSGGAQRAGWLKPPHFCHPEHACPEFISGFKDLNLYEPHTNPLPPSRSTKKQ